MGATLTAAKESFINFYEVGIPMPWIDTDFPAVQAVDNVELVPNTEIGNMPQQAEPQMYGSSTGVEIIEV